MQEKDWKRIAEKEARHYRDHMAFMRGVEDAKGGETERYRQSGKWVLAVNYVLEHLKRTDPEKERFFRCIYGIDSGKPRRGERAFLALAFEFHTTSSTLYRWRNELVSLLLIAASQTGALIPYRIEPER